MKPAIEAASWFGPSLLDVGTPTPDGSAEFERLWRGFTTARLALGAVLLLMQFASHRFGHGQENLPVLLCLGYLAAVVLLRRIPPPRFPLEPVSLPWLATLGIDLLTFTALQNLQIGTLNYAPLFALPVLMASVLGSLLGSLALAAGITLLLLAYAVWNSLQQPSDITANFLQAGLTGAGCFVLSLVAHQVASRLASAERRAQRSHLAARVQQQVNALVIESLTEGVLVLDAQGRVRASNPAAAGLLGEDALTRAGHLGLRGISAWQELAQRMRETLDKGQPVFAEVSIVWPGEGVQRLKLRTQLTAPQDGSERLCVMFLQDLREMQAQLRTEKLASMGRMSAAVAHEIRNPLAAIVQANSLLEEDLGDPRQRQLTRLIGQNAKRLGTIVDDILDVARVRQSSASSGERVVALTPAVNRICQEWQSQHESTLVLQTSEDVDMVHFEAEHLRRVLVNLLDNAHRHASTRSGSIRVTVQAERAGDAPTLRVWSDGPALDASIERHLFEPFFTSDSRSSGLGLYICRELCDTHGATILYRRTVPYGSTDEGAGNEFRVSFRTASRVASI